MNMRSPLLATLLLLAAASPLYGFALAQARTTGAGADQTLVADQSSLGSGTVLVAEFDGGLDARKLKPGDKVKAKLTQDLLVHGKILGAVDSKLVGHVTEATPKTEREPQSKLGIVFDKLLLKNHRALNFLATIQILRAPAVRSSRVDQPSQMLLPAIMGPAASTSPGLMDRGGPAAGSRAPAVVATAGSSLASNLSIDAPEMAGGPAGGTGDRTMPAKGPQTLSEANKPVSGGQGLKPGIYGIANLTLGPEDSQTPGPVIVSDRSTIKLEDGTQVVLKVAGPTAVVSGK